MVKRRTHIGYKKCADDRIVKLRILGRSNKNRKTIFKNKKRTAKHRCSKALVLDIYHTSNNNQKFDSAFGLYDNFFEYKIGEIVTPDRFDTNLNNTQSNGIHYFLVEEPAYYWHLNNLDGYQKDWHDNGQLKHHGMMKDGFVDGLHELWYDNGQKQEICNYDLGKLTGIFESWYPSGQLREKSCYNNGKLIGRFEMWYENGRKKANHFYKNGNPSGLYESWYVNGQMSISQTYDTYGDLHGSSRQWYLNGNLSERCAYNFGKLHGSYESFHENGTLNIRCSYVNGTMIGLFESYSDDKKLVKSIIYGIEF